MATPGPAKAHAPARQEPASASLQKPLESVLSSEELAQLGLSRGFRSPSAAAEKAAAEKVAAEKAAAEKAAAEKAAAEKMAARAEKVAAAIFSSARVSGLPASMLLYVSPDSGIGMRGGLTDACVNVFPLLRGPDSGWLAPGAED